MPSKSSLFLVLLFSLAQADPINEARSISLSFGPPATHAFFDTAPVNPRRRLFGDNVDDQATVLAFANWYIEHLLQYPPDSWRVTENDVRRDASTGVWRVDARQVAHNGTVEVVDGNLSLNIVNGEVISYGDSFYHGPPPDVTETGTPNPFTDLDPSYRTSEGPPYSLLSYCSTTNEVARQQWMRENPKWVEWRNGFYKSKKAWDKMSQIQERCQANIDIALEKCIEEHGSSPGPTSWVQKARLWFQRDVMKNNLSYTQDDIPQECLPLRNQIPLDLSVPFPFKVPTTYDEDTCRWNFAINYSTASARLYALGQSHCPKLDSPWRRPFGDRFEDFRFLSNYDWEAPSQNDESEPLEQEGIMNPGTAALKLLASFPPGEPESNQSFRGVMRNGWAEGAEDAAGKITSRRRPESGPYGFELQNVPGADGPVNATLVYVQTPPRKSPESITLEDEYDEEDSKKHPTSSLMLAWKLSILFKNGRRFDGYVGLIRCEGTLVRLLDLSTDQNTALESRGSEKNGAESCFGWGESAAIREGVKQFFERDLTSGDDETTSSSTERAIVKPLTYRSLNSPPHWGVDGMGHVWADILSSVKLNIAAFCDDNTSRDETLPDSNPSGGAPEKSDPLTSLIPASLTLLPCNPTFLMARDALIQADRILFDGKYACALWRGFAERGMGVGAHWDAEMTWTPWGGGKRKDGFDIPEECGTTSMKSKKADAKKNNRVEL
ncbi:Fungalysin/Thermolysin Extracellular metalloproteinase 5 [Tulasnella sp. UAMH 9824]|nr:Fungalysin/Thermolysin Extracellular metalloproteinase 5 [Tulasnella sp. UAMH 9824]